ncbi:putative bifunctional diguanylate cyclase/phosphodiesterase [Oceaniradius stylonematis]|uniref:putative bifunctional diguanylate cyclase/phosphodiesterase n=1 Tax=Oceaniradius stylonematis TaxID=2184161 RepID=UPI0011C38CAD|nr:EAL domain-containing protein [Oceaniradius stylonematis]
MTRAKGSYLVDDYLEVADFWAWETDENLVLTYLSNGFSELTGLPARDFIGRSRSQIATRDLDADIWTEHRRTLEERRPFRRFRYPLEASDGSVRWFESNGIPHHGPDGRFVGYRGVARDITEQMRDRALLAATGREAKLQQTLLAHIERVSRIGAWRWAVGDGHISMSDEIYRILGAPIGAPMTPEMSKRPFAPKSRAVFQAAIAEAIRHQQPFDLILELDASASAHRWARVIGEPEVVDGRTARLFGTFQDVTEQREQELKMRHLALTDALTGIANRAAFNEKLDEVAEKAARSGRSFLLCVIDLNRFKQVNDQYGHDVGDQVLVRFADQFGSALPQHWFFARMGGDEFAVLIGDGHRSIELTSAVDTLYEALQHEVEIADVNVTVQATAGYTVAPTHGTDVQALLRRADLALYDGKRDAATNLKCYEPEMEESFHRRVLVVQEFADALKQGRVVPWYQPVVELSSGRITGMEALARWDHPEQGILTAGQFVEVFDDARVSVELSNAMLEQVCLDMADWQQKGGSFGRIGINVTAAVLRQPGFALRVIEALSRQGLQPHNFIVEVTETTIISHAAPAVTDQLRHLREAGVSIALDDFGTGYSSLTHLKSLPFNILKIDKSFIKDLSRSAADQSIVRSLIHLGRDLGYTTVAEGIEVQAEAELLRRIGCERGQGFLFHKPMPKRDVDVLIGADIRRAAEPAR